MIALMAATRLTRARRMMGREPDGSERLRAIDGLFSEGFDEQELVEARSLLESG